MIATYYDPNLFLNIILPCYTVADDTKYYDIIGKLCVSIVSISGPKVHIIARQHYTWIYDTGGECELWLIILA